MFISALRQIRSLLEPVWTQEGAVLAYRVEHQYSGVPVTGLPARLTFNEIWFNWLKSVSPKMPTNMGLIPKEVRNQAKAIIAKLTDSKFIGMGLIIEKKGKRLLAHTQQGHLFGFIEKGHEKRLRGHQAWQIEWATATDGNPPRGREAQCTCDLAASSGKCAGGAASIINCTAKIRSSSCLKSKKRKSVTKKGSSRR